MKNFWLMKSEASCYGIDDLKNDGVTAWQGVRNYHARNFMMYDMNIGDTVFFYHSNGNSNNPTGIYGIARIASGAKVDESQFNKNDEHFDPRSKKEKPLWYCVDVKFVKKLKQPITLAEIKNDKKLTGIMVATPGSRLSIQTVSHKHGEYLLKLFS